MNASEPASPAEQSGDMPTAQIGAPRFAEVSDEQRQQLERLMGEIELSDSNSILSFGAKAQMQLAQVSEEMLEGVRTRDLGEAGASLAEVVTTLQGLDPADLDPTRKRSLFQRLFGGNPVERFADRYSTVDKHLQQIGDRLEQHKTQLMTDVAWLDRMYTAGLDYLRTLDQYLAAGREQMRRLDDEQIPELEARATANADALTSQSLRDLRATRDELDRRLHDLALTRQVTLQALPSIRLVQENNKGLVGKINSTLANTVPLWRQQIAQLIAIRRSGEAAKAVRAANDLTNRLLEAGAQNLKDANQVVREELERGVFDLESIQRSNKLLIETVEDSLRIADEGRARRAAAMQTLGQCEAELRRSLESAKARATQTGAKSPTLPPPS